MVKGNLTFPCPKRTPQPVAVSGTAQGQGLFLSCQGRAAPFNVMLGTEEPHLRRREFAPELVDVSLFPHGMSALQFLA